MSGLYIHIPLCASKCNYCNFYSVGRNSNGDRKDLSAHLVAALKGEMDERRGRSADSSDFLANAPLTSIYIGGGTPTLLEPAGLKDILEHAGKLWNCAGLKEITLEANPEDLTDEYVVTLAGVEAKGESVPTFNRLSIGIQSFDDGLLKLMNRRHDAKRAREAVRMTQKIGGSTGGVEHGAKRHTAGFGANISIDLIWGIPGMTMAQWERTLDEAAGLGVQHISAYHLTIEPGTVFGKWAAGDRQLRNDAIFAPIPEAETERQYELLCRKLSDAGFEHYEISNFAKPGYRAIHNSGYWSGEAYLGIGPSAHSFDGKKRREWVTADLEKYITAFGENTGSGRMGEIYDGETLTDRELRNERIMTGLRRVEGIDMGDFEKQFGKGKTDELIEKAERFVVKGLLVQEGKNKSLPTFRLPEEKFLLSDYIIGGLFE